MNQGIKINDGKKRIHTKLFKIDDQVSITGSLNPTYKGVTFNNENILIINNQEVNSAYNYLIDYIFDFKN